MNRLTLFLNLISAHTRIPALKFFHLATINLVNLWLNVVLNVGTSAPLIWRRVQSITL